MDWKHPFGRDHGGRRGLAEGPDAHGPKPPAVFLGLQRAPAAARAVAQGESPCGDDESSDDGSAEVVSGAPDIDGAPSRGLGFARWVLRPDARGRLGLEAPDLPEPERWWARGGFDGRPEPGDGCPKCGSLET
jgi:hypothetical protein